MVLTLTDPVSMKYLGILISDKVLGIGAFQGICSHGPIQGYSLVFIGMPNYLGHLYVYMCIYSYVYMYNTSFCNIFTQFSPKSELAS
jgi:hypothetical protein